MRSQFMGPSLCVAMGITMTAAQGILTELVLGLPAGELDQEKIRTFNKDVFTGERSPLDFFKESFGVRTTVGETFFGITPEQRIQPSQVFDVAQPQETPQGFGAGFDAMFRITAGGVVSALTDMDHTSKGLAFAARVGGG